MNTVNSTHHDTASGTAFAPAPATRLASLALSAVLTLSMLVGINTLATGDTGPAAQMALTSSTRA
jgi:hypothetical protein